MDQMKEKIQHAATGYISYVSVSEVLFQILSKSVWHIDS